MRLGVVGNELAQQLVPASFVLGAELDLYRGGPRCGFESAFDQKQVGLVDDPQRRGPVFVPVQESLAAGSRIDLRLVAEPLAYLHRLGDDPPRGFNWRRDHDVAQP